MTFVKLVGVLHVIYGILKKNIKVIFKKLLEAYFLLI
jgi:hypothetical protein